MPHPLTDVLEASERDFEEFIKNRSICTKDFLKCNCSMKETHEKRNHLQVNDIKSFIRQSQEKLITKIVEHLRSKAENTSSIGMAVSTVEIDCLRSLTHTEK